METIVHTAMSDCTALLYFFIQILWHSTLNRKLNFYDWIPRVHPCFPHLWNHRALPWKSTKFASKPAPLHPEQMSLYIFHIYSDNGSKPPSDRKMWECDKERKQCIKLLSSVTVNYHLFFHYFRKLIAISKEHKKNSLKPKPNPWSSVHYGRTQHSLDFMKNHLRSSLILSGLMQL